jgi:sugar/nucleoside kinase (ribokinase family)
MREAVDEFAREVHEGVWESFAANLYFNRSDFNDADGYAKLGDLLKKIDLLVINDEESADLTGIKNVVKAAADIRKRGPKRVIIKRGEHGALYFDDAGMFFAPGYPLEQIFDPTGAGDSFAGGLLGYIARVGEVDHHTIRKAIDFGSAMGSFCVEGIGPRRLLEVTPKDLAERMKLFMSLVDTGGPVSLE